MLRSEKDIKIQVQRLKFQTCVPNVKEGNIGLMNTDPRQMLKDNPCLRFRETGTGASPRPPDPNKSLGQSVLFQQKNNPFQSSSETKQEVQDWTSVPPSYNINT